MPQLPELDSIIHSGALAYGKYTQEFENRLKEYFNTPYLLVTVSFHLAISVVLTALDIKYGDSVIASPMACLASTQPYYTYGAKIRWADIDPSTGTLDPSSVKKRITSETKAIIHNHFCGIPGYIDEINAIGAEYGIPIIDDGIECFGSTYHGTKIGCVGSDVTVFSLTAVRFLNCIDGGIMIFKDKDLYEKSLLIRDCGIDRSRFRDSLGEINKDCDIYLPGYSATMSNINGYIGLSQMNDIESLINKHRKQAKIWDAYFENEHLATPIKRENCEPNYWVYGTLANDKTKTITEFREKGYYASGVHIRNDNYSIFAGENTDLPGTTEFSNRFVALPCGWWMDELESR